MPMNVTGRLIEMTTRMEFTQTAKALIGIGCVLAFGSVFVGLNVYTKRRTKVFIAAVIFAVIGFGLVFYGDSMPKRQLILACADGPVDLEALSAGYDIQSIEGKLITMIRK